MADTHRDQPEADSDDSPTPGASAALHVIDAIGVGHWLASAVSSLETYRDEIDDLNVYPVPDGDTGTNMLHTMRGAHAALDLAPSGASGADVVDTMRAAARGALLEARGNSGVILSQVIRGVAEAVDVYGPLDAHGLNDALRRSAERAYESVAKPVEGTILTVARAASEGAQAALTRLEEQEEQGRTALDAVLREAVGSASEALARTPAMLPALARAGVVDAGGRGLEVVLLALQAVVEGRPVTVHRLERRARGREVLVSTREEGSDEFEYEVMYLLHSDDDRVAQLRSELAQLGDSIAIVGTGDGLYNVHVHVNDVGGAIEAGIDAGRPARLTVTRFADQYAADEPGEGEAGEKPRSGRAVVAVALGEGIEGVFRSEGTQVVSGGATFNPSTADLLEAIQRTRAESVIVLPNEGNVLGVARAAARMARDDGIEAVVVPTRSTVQGLAALVARDEERPFEAEVAEMTAAAEACAWGEVTTAVRSAYTDAGEVEAGDVLGLVEGKVRAIGSDLADVTGTVLALMMDEESELVTLVLGADADEGLAESVTSLVESRWPDAEVQVVPGGQPHYPLIVGVE